MTHGPSGPLSQMGAHARARTDGHQPTALNLFSTICWRTSEHRLSHSIPIRDITTNIEDTMKYKISFIITTDADPSLLLDIATLEAKEFVDRIEADYDQWSQLDDESPCVEEVSS